MSYEKEQHYVLPYLAAQEVGGGVIIDTRTRTVFYDYQSPESIEKAGVKRLCTEFGFGRQARII